jgi:hypothetical protein
MRRSLCFVFVILSIYWQSRATASPPNALRSEAWIVNGSVGTIAESGGIIYIGGDFDHVGPNTGTGVIVNSVTGAGLAVPRIVGNVNAVAGDGVGGWFVAGQITSVNSTPRSGIAHLLANGSLDAAWNAGIVGGTINAICVSGGRVYIGGLFLSVAGSIRQSIAALNASDGSLTAWNPGQGGPVSALAISGSTIYVGGNFTSIGGAARNRIAALDTTINTNNATPWNPDANGQVFALALADSTVYAGGVFTQIGGQSRSHIAALDAGLNTNNATAWNPDNNNETIAIYALAVSGNLVYVGGEFNSIGHTGEGNYQNIAALDRTLNTNTATPWSQGASGPVRALAVSENTVYAGGDFRFIGGTTRQRVAAIDAVSGGVTSFNPVAGASVLGLAEQGGALCIGGGFQSIFGVTRDNIAAIDATTGTATSWNPSAHGSGELATGDVTVLLPVGSLVYVGGVFSSIGSAVRNHIAALDVGTGLATSWNPNADQNVLALASSGNTIYAGGLFSNIGGAARSRIAALDATLNTNNATAWDPSALNGSVYCMALSGTTLYAGGTFLNIGGAARINIAALNTTINTNNATAWNPNPDDSAVFSIVASGNTVYVGGFFTTIGGPARNRIAALDRNVNTVNATAWNPSADNFVGCLAVGTSPSIFAGGGFTTIGGQTRPRLTGLDRTINTNNATAWNPAISASQIDAISANALSIAVGGSFSDAAGTTQLNFGLFGTNSPQWTPVSPGNWSSIASWSGGAVPNNSGPTHYTADIRGTAAVVTQDISPQAAIDALNLVEGATLNVSGGDLLITSATGIQNQGHLNIAAGRSLIAGVSMTLTGGFGGIGTSPLTLGGAPAQIRSSPSTAVITNAASHTIAGQGIISANLINQGTVRASVSGALLDIAGSNAKVNNGLFEATNGGILQISSPGVSGTGAYRADGGTIRLPPNPLTGASLEARASGVIEVSGAAALNISGQVTLSDSGIYQANGVSSASLSAGSILISVGDFGGQLLTSGIMGGGQMHMSGNMSCSTSGNFTMASCGAGGGLLLGCTPPVLNMGGTNILSVDGNMNILGAANVVVGPNAVVNLSGSFVNESTDGTIFDWDQGAIVFQGFDDQDFEIAGQNFGPRNPAGFVNNFAMNSVSLATDSVVTTVDNFDNSAGTGCEVLYVHNLTLAADSQLTVGCRIYYDTLTNNGAVLIVGPGAALMSTQSGDLDQSGGVNTADIAQLVSLLLGGTCSPTCLKRADLNGDGTINGLDIDFMIEVLLG